MSEKSEDPVAFNNEKFKANKHMIFYQVENEDCIVVRILHERMDFEARL